MRMCTGLISHEGQCSIVFLKEPREQTLQVVFRSYFVLTSNLGRAYDAICRGCLNRNVDSCLQYVRARFSKHTSTWKRTYHTANQVRRCLINRLS